MEDIIKRYDRQLRTYGFDCIKSLNESSILIISSHIGYITEITKNAALSGINTIYIYECILQEKSYINLNDLNPYVKIKFINNYQQNQKVTIYIENSIFKISEINDYTRKINSSLIILFPNKIGGNIFVDSGELHYITNINDEIIENVEIKTIDEDGLVSSINNHNYESNFKISFINLEGNNLDFLMKDWSIEIINKTSFKLIDFKTYKPKNYKFINGTVIYKKEIITIKSKEFEINSIKIDNKDITSSIEPVISILGSIVTSESIKLITNKYMPINQWFNWEDNDLNSIKINNENEHTLLIVGAGAIGCELVKNLALLKLNVNLIIIDFDIIEISNLSRQFLFRDKHIGKLKCEIIKEVILDINPNIKIKTIPLCVGKDNINFKEMNLTAVLMAVDNLEARKYMDSICLDLCIPMFDSGTEGMKGSTQSIIPYITETYSNSKDPENEKSYPICTIKSFPYNNVHTIYWALDQFETIFCIEPVNKLINEIDIINIFNENYYNNIQKLLDEHPKDEKINGNLFWSEGKKCPKPIKFNNLNELHLNYIKITNLIINEKITKFDKENDLCIEWIMISSNLRAQNYNIPITDYNKTKGIAGKIIPAIPTTTSIVAGLSIIELLKYLYGNKSECNYKSNFINLSIPIIISSEPIKAPIKIIGDIKINIWEKLIYNENNLLLDFKNYYENKFKTTINIILFNFEIVYILDNDEENLNKNIKEIMNVNNILVSLNSTDNIELPQIIIT